MRVDSIVSSGKTILLWISLGAVFCRPALSQQVVRHGEVTEVHGNSITITLAAAYSVDPGTRGTLYTVESIGGKMVELPQADVVVDSRDGDVLTSSIVRANASFLASTDMYVRFEKVKRQSQRGTLLVKSSISGATVTVDGENWGLAPAEQTLPSGRHLIRVTAPGYVARQLSVSISPGVRTIRTLPLVVVEQRGTLAIESAPAGAIVTINGESWGPTPVSRDDLKSGQYQIHLELVDYVPFDTTVTVTADEPYEGAFSLERDASASTTLIIRVNVDSELAINAQVVDTLRGGVTKRLTVPADARPSLIEVTALEGSGYDNKTVVFEPGGRVPATFTLALATPDGLLIVKSEPVGATVEVSGPGGFVKRDTTNSEFRLAPGLYSLKFSKEGYETLEQDVEVSSEMRTPLSVRLIAMRFQNSVGIEFERIIHGIFLMGSDIGAADERPIHGVSLTNDFYISKYEITQDQYSDVMGLNPSFNPGGGSLPVEKVSWVDAIRFVNQLSVLEGLQECYTGIGEAYGSPYQCMGYRLPTEAEWEFVARTNREDDVESIVNEIQVRLTAWMKENSEDRTHPIGRKKPNKWGLYDLEGNVWEWVSDVYAEDFSGFYSSENPTGPPTGPKRVLRGGSYRSGMASMYVTNRTGNLPVNKSKDIGFRIVRGVK